MTIEKLLNARKTPIEYTNCQLEALNKVNIFLNSPEHFFLLAGYSGCGKTTIAENIATATKAALLAPTNAAVNRLKEKINNTALNYSTIHSALFSPAEKKNTFFVDKRFKKNGTYIIDECSMIDSYVLKIIIKQAQELKCKIIFMGDSFQLEPVGENPFIFTWEKSNSYLFLEKNRCELKEVKRYDGSLLKIATEIRVNKKAIFNNPAVSDLTVVKKFSKNLAKDINNKSNYVVITSTNRKRVEYNEKIRAYNFRDIEINDYAQDGDKLVSVSNSRDYANGEIFILNKGLLLHEFEIFVEQKNESFKTYTALLYLHEQQLTILIPNLVESSMHGTQIFNSIEDNPESISKEAKNLIIVEKTLTDGEVVQYYKKAVNIATYGYAISCHKAQGQEWDNVYIDAHWLMPVWDDAKWFYTAITRAKCKVEVTQNKYLKIN